MTTNELIEQAQRLLPSQPAAAWQMLAQARSAQKHVPEMYDILLARAGIAAGKAKAVSRHLETLFKSAPPSPRLRRVAAEALCALHRTEDAGEQLHVAAATGLNDANLPLHLALVLQDYRRRQGIETPAMRALDLRATARYGLLDDRAKLLFVYVPKNACTILKATVVMNSPHRADYLAAKTPIHEFVGSIVDSDQLTAALSAPNIFRFTVLRDPASRILSAYLNKFVFNPPGEPPGLTRNKAHVVSVGQKLIGIEPDPERGITFEEFVLYLENSHDLEMDPHWIPQWRITGADLSLYSHVGHFENLTPTFDILEARFGYKPEKDSSFHLGGQKDHATKYSPNSKLAAASRATPAELRKCGGIYPLAEDFLSPDLRDRLTRRYAIDAKLHRGM